QEAVDRELAAIGQRDLETHLAQQIALLQFAADATRAVDLALELLELLLQVERERARLAIIGEQRLALGEREARRAGVVAHRPQALARAHERERVHAQHRWHVLRAPGAAIEAQVALARQAEH